MKTIQLSIIERLGIIRMLNERYAQKGLDIVNLRRAGKIGEKIDLNENDKKKIDWKDRPMGGGADIDVKKAEKITKEFELGINEIKLIKEIIEHKNEEKGFALSEKFVVNVAEKFGVLIDDEEEITKKK